MPLYGDNLGNLVRDADGFGTPFDGGVLNVKFNTLAYTNITTPKAMFTIPIGAEIVGWMLNVSTVFNDSGTDLIDVGITGTIQKYAASLAGGSLGQITTGFIGSEMYTPLAAAVAVKAVYTGQNGNSTTGLATLACYYIVR